jgi:hypothetical protein
VSGHLYYPDGASFQAGINLSGWLAFMAKATEGTTYKNPAYAAQKAEAARRGARFGAYHFLHAGSGAAQAEWCFSVVGRGVPLMIDHEPTASTLRALLGLAEQDNLSAARSRPEDLPEDLEGGHLERLARVTDAAAVRSSPAVPDSAQFCDRYRALGGTCREVYLPKWYWQQLGSPSLAGLASRGLELVTSNYAAVSPENAAHPGWVTYGGMPPVKTLQYSSGGTVGGMRPVDLNCFRGSGSADLNTTKAELWSLWTTGKLASAPVKPPAVAEPVIRQGTSGAAVKLAQQRLNIWHASPQLTADGRFGPATQRAAVAFQRGHGLTADGVVGPKTWAALLKTP